MNVHEFIENPHPFLTGLSKEHLRMLAGCAMQTHFTAGNAVFRKGDIANRFYLIQRGKVSIEARVDGAPPASIQVVSGGDALGWSWLFPPYTWRFDATALDDSDAIFFYATRLREECEANKMLGYEMMKRAADITIHRLQATRLELVTRQTPAPLSALHAEG